MAAAVASDAPGLRGDLRALALDELKNQAAIDRLDAMAKATKGSYVFAGSPSGIERLIPGVEVTVLGPPTLEQDPEIERAAAADPEFWMLYQSLVEGGFAAAALADSSGDDEGIEAVETAESETVPAGPQRWLSERLRRHEIQSLARVVRRVDDALNNTSVILLVQAGTKRMLFPGDAQIENWRLTLDKLRQDRNLRDRLSRIDLYKVGHHGSRNATPRSLFALWTTGRNASRPMMALMSTRSGVHGESEATAVPRSTLVAALRDRMTLISTDDDESRDVIEVAASLRTRDPFTVVSSPG